MGPEVTERSLGDLELLLASSHGLDTGDLIWVTLGLALHVRVDILGSLLDITSDVEGITRSLGDGETVVECDATGDGTETAGDC